MLPKRMVPFDLVKRLFSISTNRRAQAAGIGCGPQRSDDLFCLQSLRADDLTDNRRTAVDLFCWGLTAYSRKATENLAGVSAGQPNLHILEYTCEHVRSLHSVPHPVVPKLNATVAVTPAVGLPFPDDNEVVHTRIYLSHNRPGVPPALKFEHGI